jgi:hypothetical protein
VHALARGLLFLSGVALARNPEDVMHTNSNPTRWLHSGLLTLSLLSMASVAYADHGRRFKGVDAVPVQRVFVREHSSAAPVVAALIGGFILGNAVNASSHTVYVSEGGYYSHPYVHSVAVYRYWDPYHAVWYDSLDECQFHYYHPRVVQVIDVSTGRNVRSLRFHHGAWHRFDEDFGG